MANTTFYFRSALQAASVASPPIANLPAAIITVANGFAQGGPLDGANAAYLSTEPGTGQFSVIPTWGPANSGDTLGVALYLSDPLAAQTINAGTWSMAFGLAVSAPSDVEWAAGGGVALIDGTSGSIKAVIASGAVGVVGRRPDGEVSVFDTSGLSGSSASVSAGDYLAAVLAFSVGLMDGETPIGATYTDGLTPITTDAVPITDAQAILQAPQELMFLAARA